MLKRIIAGVVSLIIAVWLYYLALPAINIRSDGLWMYLLCIAIISLIAFSIVECLFADYDEKKYGTIASAVIAVVLLISLIGGGLTHSPVFQHSKYKRIVEIKTQEGAIQEVLASPEATPVVDWEMAKNLGIRVLGTLDPQTATWFELNDEFNLIKYQGRYVRVSPLEYGSIFKYGKASDNGGVPGYVMIDVYTQEATYVEFSEGMQYVPSAHFSNRLRRHLRGQYPSEMFGKSFFELDEEGNPYYITSIKQPTIGLFGGKKEDKYIITNAITGESEIYNISELPEWVDHPYSIDYLMNKINNVQRYVNGWWNPSKTGIMKTTYQYKGSTKDTDGNVISYFAGYNTLIDSNGEIWVYTGVTPVNNSESNVGFILASCKTGEIKYYAYPGAEESSAQAAAEGLVQHLGYSATFPNMVNVGGKATYYMLLKDKSGVARLHALCNVKDYTKVVQAETLEESLELYAKLMSSNSYESSEEEITSISGIIKELYQVEIDGCTYFIFSLNGNDSLYMSSIKNSAKQVLLKAEMEVTVTYNPNSNEEGVYMVTDIDF